MTTATVSPGVAGEFPEVTLSTGVTGDLTVSTLQDITINNSNDVYSWTQLNSGSKLQVATTATNSVSSNMVVDSVAFFGTTPTGSTPVELGVFGLSKNKTKVSFTITNVGGKTISGEGYITGLAPKVSADQPVWVTPVTITVTGDFTVA